jgi:hypothetical protein
MPALGRYKPTIIAKEVVLIVRRWYATEYKIASGKPIAHVHDLRQRLGTERGWGY